MPSGSGDQPVAPALPHADNHAFISELVEVATSDSSPTAFDGLNGPDARLERAGLDSGLDPLVTRCAATISAGVDLGAGPCSVCSARARGVLISGQVCLFGVASEFGI